MTEFAVTHVIDSLAAETGGPAYSVPALADALAGTGVEVRLRSLSGAAGQGPAERRNHAASEGLIAGRLRVSPGLHQALVQDAAQGALIHTHGLWLMPNIYPAHVRRRASNARIVHSPRGMLSAEALRISPLRKRLVWRLMQERALRVADSLHATADAEYEEIRAAGLTNPVAVIANGVDLPELPPRAPARSPTVLSLGRIHPKKGLDRLLQAWSRLEATHPQWCLRIIGPPELGHDEALRRLAESLSLQRVSIEPAAYGEAKLAAYRCADLFVLPTLNENFGVAVAEALAAEVPVICTKGAPWSGLAEHRCGWWIDHGVEPLTAALAQAMGTPPAERQAMGERGRAWMARDFSWNRVAAEMLDVYRWLKLGGEPPPTVRFD